MVEARMAGGGAETLDTVGFRVPCRSFYVRANITRDRRMPVIDEHVLRLVRVCTQITAERLRDFFGLSRSEIETVLTDLTSKDLLTVEQDGVRLSTAAAAMFKASPDEEPQLITVEPWIEHVWIDLVSRNFVSRPRPRPPRNLVDVAAPRNAIDLPTTFARQAFEENFYDYVRRVRQLRNPDRVSIHSIADVEAGRFGTATISGRRVLDRDARSPRLEIDAPPGDPLRFRRLIETLATEYGRLEQPRSTSTSIELFERLTGVSLSPFLDGQDGFFDVRRWLAARSDSSMAAQGGTWLLGAPYVKENVEIIVRHAGLLAGRLQPEVIWLRPGGSSWGMTSDLGDALGAFRKAIGLADSPRDQGATLLFPRSAREVTARRLDRHFQRGAEAPSRAGGALEILLLGGRLAVVTVHVGVDRRETIPLGVLTADPSALGRVGKLLQSSGAEAWSRSAEREDRTYEQDVSGP